MKVSSAFLISKFTNPSGEIVFRVSGWLDGKRVRKNFPTRPEAEAEAQALEIQRLNGETGIRMTATRLTEDQLREAESLFQRVSGLNRPLSFYVEFALANYREPSRQKVLTEAAAEYLATKEREYQQGQLTMSKIRDGRTYLGDHLTANDYYCENESVAGKWVGLGAAQLGLQAEIHSGDAAFEALRQNRLPDGSGNP